MMHPEMLAKRDFIPGGEMPQPTEHLHPFHLQLELSSAHLLLLCSVVCHSDIQVQETSSSKDTVCLDGRQALFFLFFLQL